MGLVNPPGPPSNLQVREYGGRERSVVVSYDPPTNAERDQVTAFVIKQEWFDPETPMIDPVAINSKEVNANITEVHMDSPERDRNIEEVVPAVTVKITVHALNKCGKGEDVTKRITFDSVFLSDNNAQVSWTRDIAKVRTALGHFSTSRHGRHPKFIVFGQQHHGKTSLLNHLKRFASAEMSIEDPLAAAPASMAETTHALKRLPLLFGEQKIELQDTPAFSSMTPDVRTKVQALLTRGIPDGTRRNAMQQAGSKWTDPPDGAVVVVSLPQWRDDREKTKDWLKGLQEEFKTAAQGRVEFPYIVVATKRDLFLRECQDAKPHFKLDEALRDIKRDANTEQVFAITNYKYESLLSRETNVGTCRALCGLTALAENHNTGVVAQGERVTWYCLAGAAGIICLLAVAIANAK